MRFTTCLLVLVFVGAAICCGCRPHPAPAEAPAGEKLSIGPASTKRLQLPPAGRRV